MLLKIKGILIQTNSQVLLKLPEWFANLALDEEDNNIDYYLRQWFEVEPEYYLEDMV